MVVIGLKAALPISFSQICGRRSASTGHLSPPAVNAAAMLRQTSFGCAAGRADREPRALDVPDHARGGDLGRAVDDAAHHLLGADRPADDPAGVDALHDSPLQRPVVPLEVPPGDAVLRRDDDRARTQQLADPRRERGQAVGLHTEHDDVGVGDGRELGGGRRMGVEVATRAVHADAVLRHRPQVLAAGDQGDVRAAACQRRPDVGADRPRAEHGEPHGSFPASCARQPRALHLAGRRLRDLVEHVDALGHLERGQRLARVPAKLVGRRVAVRARRPPARPGRTSPSSTPNATASATCGCDLQHGLDLVRRDVLAAADDHFLQPAAQAQVAVLQHALVAGPEPAVEERLSRWPPGCSGSRA